MNNVCILLLLMLISINASGYEETILIGHSDDVSSAYFSKDEKLVVSCAEDENILIWNASKGSVESREIVNREKFITSKWNNNSTMLVSLSDKSVKLWKLNLPYDIDVVDGINMTGGADVEWNPNGNEIIVGIDSNIYVYDILIKSIVNNITIGDLIEEVQFNPNGEDFAISTSNGSVIVWDHIHNKIKMHLNYNTVSNLYWSNNGSLLVLGYNNEVKFLKEGYQILNIQDAELNQISEISLNNDENLLAIGSTTGLVNIWDINSKSLYRSLDLNDENTIYKINTLDWNDNNQLLITVDTTRFYLWDTNNDEVVITFFDLDSVSPTDTRLPIQFKIYLITLIIAIYFKKNKVLYKI